MFDPVALLAVSVYVVVAVGLTVVEPVPEVDVNVPGVIEIPVAPVVVQLSVLLPPEEMLVGFAVNELITGNVGACTVTTAVAVAEPAALVAVRTYVVVVSGLTFVEPLAEVDANVPGVIVIVVAPAVAQFSVLTPPKVMPVGLAVNELIVGKLGGTTVTVATAVAVPVLFVAVSV